MTDRSQPSIPSRLFSLALPVIGINMLSVLTLAVDTAMCGRLEDSERVLKALGFATQLVFLLMVVMMGLTVGTVALVSRAYGARDKDRVNHVLIQSTTLTVLVSIGVAVVGNVFAGVLMKWLGASPDVVDAGLDYLRPVLGGTVFYYLTILYGAVLRGVGNTRLPFMVALFANALNIFLNYCLILGNLGFPALGVQGAAIATVISYAFNVSTVIYLIRRGAVPHLYLPLKPETIDAPMAREFFTVGVPAALDMLILNAAFLSIIGMLGRINEIAVAAHGIGLRMQAMAFVPGLSVSQATGAMVGNALGARDPGEARHIARASMVLCTVIMSAFAGMIVLAAYNIVAIFDVARGSELEAYSVEWMRLLGYGMPIVGAHIAIAGVLQGSGATRTSLRINFWGTLVFQIPLSYLLGFTFDMGAFGVWLAFPLSFVIKTMLAVIAYKQGNWAKLGLKAS